SVGIAQKVAELPLLSGLWFRTAVMIPALGIWVWGTMRYASRHRVPATGDEMNDDVGLSPRHLVTLAAVVATFVLYVYGAVQYSWGFDEMSALFLLMGVAVGLLGGLGVTGTSNAFVDGF